MDDQSLKSVYLHRIDPDRNMHRFYAASVQPTLFGDMAVMRCWGRIGHAGQIKTTTFEHATDAYRAFDRLVTAKRRRGYVPPSAGSDIVPELG